MPPIILLKPIQATLTHNTEYIGKMSPYCTFVIGRQKIKGKPCKKGGMNPTWSDVIAIPFDDHPTCLVQVKHKDMIRDSKIGSFEIDLHAIEAEGNSRKWYTLFYKDRPAGQILIETIYHMNLPTPMDANYSIIRKSMTTSPAAQDDSTNSNQSGLYSHLTTLQNRLGRLGSAEIFSTVLPQSYDSSSGPRQEGGYAHQALMRGVGALQDTNHNQYIRSSTFP